MLGGLWLSIVVMVVGLVVAGIEGAKASTHALPLDQELSKLAAGKPAALVDLGILLLFATPLAAVITALVEFVLQGDRTYTGITVALVIILGAGFAVALH